MIHSIPVLTPFPDAPDGSGANVQPILSFKELEVDRVRYDAYKAMIEKAEARRAALVEARRRITLLRVGR